MRQENRVPRSSPSKWANLFAIWSKGAKTKVDPVFNSPPLLVDFSHAKGSGSRCYRRSIWKCCCQKHRSSDSDQASLSSLPFMKSSATLAPFPCPGTVSALSYLQTTYGWPTPRIYLKTSNSPPFLRTIQQNELLCNGENPFHQSPRGKWSWKVVNKTRTTERNMNLGVLWHRQSLTTQQDFGVWRKLSFIEFMVQSRIQTNNREDWCIIPTFYSDLSSLLSPECDRLTHWRLTVEGPHCKDWYM